MSNAKAINLVINDKRELQLALSIIKYHATEIQDVSMHRVTADNLQQLVEPTSRSPIPNPFVNDVILFGHKIVITDALDLNIVKVDYCSKNKADDDAISRKLESYSAIKQIGAINYA